MSPTPDPDPSLDDLFRELEDSLPPETVQPPRIPLITSAEVAHRNTRRHWERQTQARARAALATPPRLEPTRSSPRDLQPKFPDGLSPAALRTSPQYAHVCLEHVDLPNEYVYLHRSRTTPRQYVWLTTQGTLLPGTRAYLSLGEAVVHLARQGYLDTSW